MENPAQKSYQLYIDGQWVDASDGGTLDVFCPANGEQLSTIADATKEDVDRAVDAAWKAFETWRTPSTTSATSPACFWPTRARPICCPAT